jgi:hypothetical protein
MINSCSLFSSSRLTDHNDELKAITAESKQAIQEAETHLEKTSTIHALVVDKKQRSNNIGRLVEDQKRTLRESDISMSQERSSTVVFTLIHILHSDTASRTTTKSYGSTTKELGTRSTVFTTSTTSVNSIFDSERHQWRQDISDGNSSSTQVVAPHLQNDSQNSANPRKRSGIVI